MNVLLNLLNVWYGLIHIYKLHLFKFSPGAQWAGADVNVNSFPFLSSYSYSATLHTSLHNMVTLMITKGFTHT